MWFSLLWLSLFAPEGPWTLTTFERPLSFRGLSAVDQDMCWVGGPKGTVLRVQFREGQVMIEDVSVEGATSLDFRDVHSFDRSRALVMNAGSPNRFYLTEDRGKSWDLVYENEDDGVFFDAVAFWDDRRGLAFSDPVDNRLYVVMTEDGGRTWSRLAEDRFPKALSGEAGFAASGTCLCVHGLERAWIGLGGTERARVFRTEDAGLSWEVQTTPLVGGGNSQGVFSVTFWSPLDGVCVGGDYQELDHKGQTLALTRDGGVTWTKPETGGLGGFRSAVVAIPKTKGPTLIATGPNGCDRSTDGGKSWAPFSDEGFHSISGGDDGVLWAAGAGGRIARVSSTDVKRQR